MDLATEVGLTEATAQGVSELEEQVQRAVATGAKSLTGGKRVNGPGNTYEPTVFANIPKSNAVYYQGNFRPGGDAVPR